MQRRMASASIGTLTPIARAAVRELLLRGPLPRAHLARILELSPASMTKATRELLDRGFVAQNQAILEEGRGRPGLPVSIVGERIQFIGIKVTAEAVFAVRVDALGAVLASLRRSLLDTSPDHVTAHIVRLVNELASGQPVHAVGIGLAGNMSRFDDRVRSNTYLGWTEVELAPAVESATGLPTVVSSDIRALTAGVQWWGPGRAFRDFAVVTIGVGVGLCCVVGDRVVTGARGAAGMVGHHRISDSGPVCELGHRGCAAAYLTTSALTHAMAAVRGEPICLADVCRLADEGDRAARRLLTDAGTALGALMAEFTNILDLEAIVLTGDGLPIIDHAMPSLRASLGERIDPLARLPHIEVLASDFDEWARGAAVVACQWLLLEPPAASRLGDPGEAPLARSTPL